MTITPMSATGLALYISPIYIGYTIRYFRSKILDILNFYGVLKNICNLTHCDYVLIFSLCVLLAYDLCPQHFLSVGQLLSDCTSLQQCSVNNKSIHVICNAHAHILLLGSKFHIILAMYVQMLDIYIENIRYFRYFRKYHNIFQPWSATTLYCSDTCCTGYLCYSRFFSGLQILCGITCMYLFAKKR